MMPLIVRGMIASQDPPNGTVGVMLATGQLVNAFILYPGANDALRIHQHPLPQRGTYGIVAFPNGDFRNAIWLGAFFPSQQDAITTGPENAGQSANPNASQIDYHAAYSGYWRYHDAVGTTAHQWPDSSSVVVGNNGVLPTVFRHIVDGDQNRVQTAFTMADRVANPPAQPFPFTFNHKSGTSIVVDVSGNVTITNGPNGNIVLNSPNNNISLAASGNITISASGNVGINAQGTMSLAATGNLSATTQGNLSVTVHGSSAINSTGNMTITAPTVAVVGNLNATGTITAGEGGGDQVGLQTHIHTGVQTGSGSTAAPTPGT